jgi:hypothetical protein
MSTAELMREALGEPDPAVPISLPLYSRAAELQWEATTDGYPAGWFGNGFLYLLGPGLEELKPCLDAWSWLVGPGHADRTILGRNAYGAIAYADGLNAGTSRVFVVDPLTLSLITEDGMDLVGFFARYVPGGLLPTFLDDSAYNAWLATSERRPEINEILGIKAALPLDGTMDPSNFALVDIVDYYETTAPVYAEVYAELKE